ncbi:hypothetical protein KC361_g9215 [Hortaea werneckii]|nr:hypothetical protein KC361_g9215 [Hortaea werneckii]KAI7502086.1 hypothetical protein KC347_g9052 [Hortaea werneckii]
MNSEAVTSIADSPWPHRAHASSSNSGASSTDGERCSTPGILRPSKRKRSLFPNTKEVHPAWTYARTRLPHEPERNRHYQKLFYCKQCDYCQPIQNAEQHLRSSHGRQKEKGESLSRTEQEKLLFNVLDNRRFRDALARFIVRANVSHRVVELNEFEELCRALNPQCAQTLLKSHTSIPRQIHSNYERQRRVVAQALQSSASRINICTDSWTSGINHQGEFQSIYARFVSRDGRLQHTLLAVPELHHGHAGELVAPLVMQTLETYGVEKRLGYLTADNASANDTLCRAIEESLSSRHGIDWDARQNRLRCLGHVLNIAVQAFLFCRNEEAFDTATQRVLNSGSVIEDAVVSEGGFASHGPLNKVYRLAVAVRNLALHKEFKDLAGKVLKLPGETRWNAWYGLLADAIECRDAIARMIDRHAHLEAFKLSRDEWQTLQDASDFLQPFHQVTMLSQGDQATFDSFQVQIDFLIKHYEDSERRFTSKAALLAAVNTSWIAFNKYYELSDDVPVHSAAVLLHPGYRKAYMDKVWKKRWIKPGIERAKKLFETRYQQCGTESSMSDAAERNEARTAWDIHRTKLLQSLTSQSQDEFSAFVNATPTKIAGSPIEWWSQPDQKAAYPQLWQMAIDCLSAMPMSAASGQVIQEGQCLKDWQRRGYACHVDDEYESDSSHDEDPLIPVAE